MKRDILSRSDIEIIIDLFYERVRSDESIGFFFTRVVQLDWEKHNALMCDFWEGILFYTGSYEGNPLHTHRLLNRKHATESRHFERWLVLFNETIDSLYKGKNANKMKKHAKGIAAVMQEKAPVTSK